MRDFSLLQYRSLLLDLQQAGYRFLTVAQYARSVDDAPNVSSCLPASPDACRTAILRHDVDLLPENSVRTAQIEKDLGIRATYYFRIVPESNRPECIRRIAAMGHEIGYHYEDLSTARGNLSEAWRSFSDNLAWFRTFYPVETICMHGAPRSGFDSRDLWKHYDYRSLGIIAEPYLDFDYSRLFYLTDTGRRWDGYKVSVRDKIPVWQDRWNEAALTWHTTPQLAAAVRSGRLPAQVLVTTHPQRWTDSFVPWMRELLLQNAKNIVKRLLV